MSPLYYWFLLLGWGSQLYRLFHTGSELSESSQRGDNLSWEAHCFLVPEVIWFTNMRYKDPSLKRSPFCRKIPTLHLWLGLYVGILKCYLFPVAFSHFLSILHFLSLYQYPLTTHLHRFLPTRLPIKGLLLAQPAEVLAAKMHGLGLISRTHGVEGENWFPQVNLWPPQTCNDRQ